jgi:hypothetical protein
MTSAILSLTRSIPTSVSTGGKKTQAFDRRAVGCNLVVLKMDCSQSHCKIQAPFSALPCEQFKVLGAFNIKTRCVSFCFERGCPLSGTGSAFALHWSPKSPARAGPGPPGPPPRSSRVVESWSPVNKIVVVPAVEEVVLTLHPPLRPLSHDVNPRNGAQDILCPAESSWSCSGGGDWGDYDHDSSEAAAAWPVSLPRWVGAPFVFFWRAHALRSKSEGPFQKQK